MNRDTLKNYYLSEPQIYLGSMYIIWQPRGGVKGWPSVELLL